MRNLIFNVFAFKEVYDTSSQIRDKDSKIDIYLKNIFVSLVSSKKNNLNDDVALITNTPIPSKYEALFKRENIEIYLIPFDNFVFPSEFKWALAFFKLCALKYVVENLDYDNYLLLDGDTYVVNNFEDIWNDCSSEILLYNVGYRYSHPHRLEIIENYEKLYGVRKNISHYGGEFIAGNRKLLYEFIKNQVNLYLYIKKNNFIIDKSIGDEFITSIVAEDCKHFIRDASPYIYRYWTGKFYLTSTNYIANSIDIWHVPSEKEGAFIYLFNYYIKNNRFPSLLNSSKLFGFPQKRRPNSIRYIYNKLNTRINIKLKTHINIGRFKHE